MQRLILFTVFTFMAIQLPGCASSGASTNQPVDPSYSVNTGIPSNMDYIYRSPPPNVARALSGR